MSSDVHLAGTTLSDGTGERRTKVCNHCNTEKDITEFSRRLTGYDHRCKDCYGIYHATRNQWRELANRIAGGRTQFRALPEDERNSVAGVAKQMYELGADFSTANSALATEKRGFVYVITHPAFPGYVKVGRAYDPESRLKGYQTGCPHRAYELYAAVYFEDCHFAEHEIHARLCAHEGCGEWFAISPFLARHTINKLRSLL